MATFGYTTPDHSDDEVREDIGFWENKALEHESNGEHKGAAQCREMAAVWRAEAKKRKFH